MAQLHSEKPGYEGQLKIEAERVLGDIIFKRSPVQSRLLRYLVDSTFARGASPTQRQIAVDGLGRSEDYDTQNDSYPRVQISRLRKNLDSYYARCKPNSGRRLEMHSTKYRLQLARSSAQAPGQAPHDLQVTGHAERLLSNQNTKMQLNWPLLRIGIYSLVFWVAVAWIAIPTVRPYWPAALTYTPSEVFPVGPQQKPAVQLIVKTNTKLGQLSTGRETAATVTRIGEIGLTNSLVSRLVTPELASIDHSYTLLADLGEDGTGQHTAFLALTDALGDNLYSTSIPFDLESPEALLSELQASIVYVTSPRGVIARRELEAIGSPPGSAYACFLAIENGRSNLQTTGTLVDECIHRFPNDEFQAFWLARRAYRSYQERIVNGGQVGRDGEAWNDLQAAIQADPFNPFANFVAAKVEMALDDCENAKSYIDRSLERGNSYPILVAAIEYSALACSAQVGGLELLPIDAETFIKHNPDPDPLLRLYLLTAALARGDIHSARTIVDRSPIFDPAGRTELTYSLLQGGIQHPEMDGELRETIKENLKVYLWTDDAISKVITTLENSSELSL